MKKALFIANVIFFSIGSICFSQNGQSIITGKVFNQESGEPISDVNVFLSQTTLGTTTNSDGMFSMKGIPNGIYNLVFSFTGFQREVKKVQLFEPDSTYYRISLRPVSTRLKGIVVTAERDHEWLENLEIFKREFIGASRNADKTLIKNPEVLNFKWDDDKSKLSASSRQKIHIVNNALGYEVFLELKKFTYQPSTNKYRDKTSYFIYPRYEEMEAVNDNQKQKWAQNRKEAYTGSLRHFMRSLYHNNATENFDIKNGSIDKIEREKKEYLLRYKLLNREYKKKLKAFEYSIYPNAENGALAIHFNGDDPSFFFPTDQNIFFIDEYGTILNVESTFVGGNWHADRVADDLPLNYTPTN